MTPLTEQQKIKYIHLKFIIYILLQLLLLLLAAVVVVVY